MSYPPLRGPNVANDDTDDVLYSPLNDSARMLHCNPLEDTVAGSLFIGTRLAAKFDSAQEIVRKAFLFRIVSLQIMCL
jgi:hypothetical protein